MKPEVLATIYAETLAKRKLPVNFNQEHLPLFEGELERVIPETQLLRFRDVLASPEGLLFKGTSILPESWAVSYQNDEGGRRSVVFFI